MILFGRKAHHLGLTTSNKVKCENCGKKDLAVSIFQKFFHMLWVPMFPVKRECASQCLQCQNVLVEKKFSIAAKSLAAKLRKEHKTPFWSFFGIFLGLIILLIKSVFF
jgi:hypothetical protein